MDNYTQEMILKAAVEYGNQCRKSADFFASKGDNLNIIEAGKCLAKSQGVVEFLQELGFNLEVGAGRR
jgi:hypothetical protein